MKCNVSRGKATPILAGLLDVPSKRRWTNGRAMLVALLGTGGKKIPEKLWRDEYFRYSSEIDGKSFQVTYH